MDRRQAPDDCLQRGETRCATCGSCTRPDRSKPRHIGFAIRYDPAPISPINGRFTALLLRCDDACDQLKSDSQCTTECEPTIGKTVQPSDQQIELVERVSSSEGISGRFEASLDRIEKLEASDAVEYPVIKRHG